MKFHVCLALIVFFLSAPLISHCKVLEITEAKAVVNGAKSIVVEFTIKYNGNKKMENRLIDGRYLKLQRISSYFMDKDIGADQLLSIRSFPQNETTIVNNEKRKKEEEEDRAITARKTKKLDRHRQEPFCFIPKKPGKLKFYQTSVKCFFRIACSLIFIVLTSYSAFSWDAVQLEKGTSAHKLLLIFIPSGFTPDASDRFETEVRANLEKLWQNNFLPTIGSGLMYSG